MIMDETGTRTRTSEIVNVIETVSEIGGNQHPRGPRGEICEARISAITKAIGEASSRDKLVNEINIIAGDGSSEEFNETAVVTPADKSEAVTEF